LENLKSNNMKAITVHSKFLRALISINFIIAFALGLTLDVDSNTFAWCVGVIAYFAASVLLLLLLPGKSLADDDKLE
jgi:hypothetical protein